MRTASRCGGEARRERRGAMIFSSKFFEQGRCGGSDGQMTVEAAVVMPAMVMLAFVFVSAFVFVGDCVAFDIAVRDSVRMQADDGYEGGQGAAEVRARVEERLGIDEDVVEVTCERLATGHVRYTASIEFRPSFLRGVSVFGMSAPSLRHETSMVVSPYRKGVVV